MNKIFLGGRIGWIKTETIPSGGQVCRTSLAEKVTRKGQKETQWHKAAGFNKVAELLDAKFNTGDYLVVEGRLEQSTWVSNGQTHHKSEVVIDKILWDECRIASPSDSQTNSNNQSQPTNNQNTGSAAGGAVYSTEDFEDDVPL